MSEKPILFISDLHLDESRPAVTRLFFRFLRERAARAEALYILGDFFEAWIGDDAVPPDHPVIAALRALTDSGVPLYVMRGNRDFLLGERFAQMTGAMLLADPTVIDLQGIPTLLMHGDSLCTDDAEYQQFRAMVHNPQWQAQFLAKAIPERIAMAKQARQESMSRNSALAEEIMDVNDDAVRAAMEKQGVRRLIHGHTHRPKVHNLETRDGKAQRIVLGDWYDQGSLLRCEDGECELMELPL